MVADLPEMSLQMVVTAIGGVIIYVLHNWNKNRATSSDPAVSKDVIVPTLTVADGGLIRDQIQHMREMMHGNAERDRQIRDMQAQLQQHTDQLNTMIRLGRTRNDLIQELTDHVRDVLRRGVEP